MGGEHFGDHRLDRAGVAGLAEAAGLDDEAGILARLEHDLEHLLGKAARNRAVGDEAEIVEERGLKQTSDTGAIEAVIADVMAANADKVAEYRSGKDKLFGDEARA